MLDIGTGSECVVNTQTNLPEELSRLNVPYPSRGKEGESLDWSYWIIVRITGTKSD